MKAKTKTSWCLWGVSLGGTNSSETGETLIIAAQFDFFHVSNYPNYQGHQGSYTFP